MKGPSSATIAVTKAIIWKRTTRSTTRKLQLPDKTSTEKSSKISHRWCRDLIVPIKKIKIEGSPKSIITEDLILKSEFTCSKCGQVFDDPLELQSHSKNHAFCCDHCNESFRLRVQLLKHITNAHKSVSKYFCTECENAFSSRQSLQMHFVRKHTEGSRFTCATCEKKFKIKHDLYMHIQNVHNDKCEAVCDVCGKTYRNASVLKSHRTKAHNQHPYACEICKLKLATMKSLEKHVQLHLRKKQVVCQICGKTFTGHLKRHMDVHIGVKPHSCKVCGKTFRRRSTYKQHLLTHTNARAYECDICGESFAQKAGLITHRKQHPGPLPPLPPISIDFVIADLL